MQVQAATSSSHGSDTPPPPHPPQQYQPTYQYVQTPAAQYLQQQPQQPQFYTYTNQPQSYIVQGSNEIGGVQVLVPVQTMSMIQAQPVSFVQIPSQQESTTIIVKEQPSPQPQYYQVKSMSEEIPFTQQQQSYVTMGVPFMAKAAAATTSTNQAQQAISPPRSISSNSQYSNTTPSLSDSSGSSSVMATSAITSMSNTSSERNSPDKPRRAIQKRNRSAAREELKFIQIQEDGSNEVAKIRVWVNEKNMAFYDCSCEKRKPVQDLNKIKLHVMGHLIKKYTCSVCSRDFANYRQLNGHLRIHQTNKRREPSMIMDMQNLPVQATSFMGPPLQPAHHHQPQTVMYIEAPQHHRINQTPQVIYYSQ